ncbi:neuritin-like protein isoform X2 [Engystomops pustulosus]|uniref:neuritin-like protein isoform X2 n=1 Tax=Engystomops pustulosus TaxID=76066 RepID=UPI003AFA71B3
MEAQLRMERLTGGSASLHSCRTVGTVLQLLQNISLLHIPVRATSRKCDTIYKGFADCLINLGDSMSQNVQQSKVNEEIDDAGELDSICKSWDEFHKCASSVLINCPEDTAAIWESLRQESRKIQYQGNLHDLCTSRNHRMGAMDTGETNKETLRGLGCMIQHNLLTVITPVLVWITIEKAL